MLLNSNVLALPMTEKDMDQSAPDQRAKPNLLPEPTTNSSKRMISSTGTVTTNRENKNNPVVMATKSPLNTLPSTENTKPKRPSQTPKLPASPKPASQPTASEERAPSI